MKINTKKEEKPILFNKKQKNLKIKNLSNYIKPKNTENELFKKYFTIQHKMCVELII